MSSLKGRRVLITGAARGIGRLLCESVAREGGHVVAWDVDEAGLEALLASVPAPTGSVTTFTCDLTDRAQVNTAAAAVLADLGPVDVLINNAGIVSGGPLLALTDAQIERTFAVNALAPFWTTRAFLPTMIARGEGHVVTVSSAAGLVGTPRLTDYSASKFAAFGFDESLRLELRRIGAPIDTTVVCPFFVETGLFDGVRTRFPRLFPILQPEYVAARILEAVRKKRRRVILPPFVYIVFAARLLPVPAFDALARFFGITQSMDAFTGRPPGTAEDGDRLR